MQQNSLRNRSPFCTVDFPYKQISSYSNNQLAASLRAEQFCTISCLANMHITPFFGFWGGEDCDVWISSCTFPYFYLFPLSFFLWSPFLFFLALWFRAWLLSIQRFLPIIIRRLGSQKRRLLWALHSAFPFFFHPYVRARLVFMMEQQMKVWTRLVHPRANSPTSSLHPNKIATNCTCYQQLQKSNTSTYE